MMLPVLAFTGLLAAAAPAKGDWQASGRQGVVVAGATGSVHAGMAVLRAGGNAADAAAATLLALTVTDAHDYAFGGELCMLVYDARRGVVEALSGQGVAPQLATLEHFTKKGHIPLEGIEPAAVPGTLDAVITTLSRYGTRPFAQVVEPTLALLDRKEKPWHADLARTLRHLAAVERAAGADRVRGLRQVAHEFYRGSIARKIDAFSRQNGGLLRFSDLATHVTRVEDPVSVSYRGREVHKCGPATQGPVLLQTLRLLEGWNLASMGHNSPTTIHTIVESMKLALADRDVYYADPLFAEVPLEALLSPEYAKLRRALVGPTASLEQRPGDPRRGRPLLDKGDARVGLAGPVHDTSTCITADAQGNVVVATPSGWKGVLAKDTGVWLGTRLQSFNIWPGHPNVIAPGKRPRNTLTPTLVLKDGKPEIAISVKGGDLQDQVALQVLLNMIDFGMTPARAVVAPRFGTNHHTGSFGQTPPKLGSLEVYEALGATTIKALRARGHVVTIAKPPLANPAALRIDQATGRFDGAGDPAASRHAGAF